MKTQVINKLTRVKRRIPYSYKEIGTGIRTVSKLFQLGNGAHQGSVPNNLRLRILKGGPRIDQVFMVLYDDTPRPVFEGNVFGKAFVKRSLEARSIRLCS